jgi:hypothetical protein
MPKCNFNGCESDVYKDNDKCILHCNKEKVLSGLQKLEFNEEFYKALVEYSLNWIFQIPNEGGDRLKESVRAYLIGGSEEIAPVVISFIEGQTVVFRNIYFPKCDDNEVFDYKKILETLKGVFFIDCQFFISSLDLRKTNLFFQECIFQTNWYLYDHLMLKNDRGALYLGCTFKEDVDTVAGDYVEPKLENAIFSDCFFEKDLLLSDVKIVGQVFSNSEGYQTSVKNIHISECTIESKFMLNSCKIGELKFENSEFKNKMEFKENTVNIFEINNTNYRKLVDCYKTTFNNFIIIKSIFDDFVGFEDCIFSNNAKFRYATFMSFINFRNAQFVDGLDLQHINLKEPPNFLNSTVSDKNTNRETFRIIKYSFDKVGNFIEANKFYEMEMLKLKKELSTKRKGATYCLLRTYEITSKFGQSYVRPVAFTVITALIYWLLIYLYEKKVFSIECPIISLPIEYLFCFLNGIAKHILPLDKVLKEGMEFISLVFYVLFTVFIWLVILAIKRSTKR